jgi:hypothetical protein
MLHGIALGVGFAVGVLIVLWVLNRGIASTLTCSRS